MSKGQRGSWSYALHSYRIIPRIPNRVWGFRAFFKENLEFVVGSESNAHHSVWDSTNCNRRGEVLVEFLNSTNLEILNRGNLPNFCSGNRSVMIDITLGSLSLLESIIVWEVSSETSLSDHRHIPFLLRVAVTVRLIRNPRGTNWYSIGDLRDRLRRGPVMDTKSEAGLGLAIHWVQQATVLAYEYNCPLKSIKTGTQILKWTTELESLRR